MRAAPANTAESITQLLVRWRAGDPDALDQLTRLIYAQLRYLAASILQKERAGHTLEPTALVHEFYLRLRGARETDWQGRAQFFSITARVMRQILVDHARKRGAAKRAPGLVALGPEAFAVTGPDIVEIDAALSRLARDHPRQARVLELRFFGGLTAEETVETLNGSGEDVSLRTVERDWRFSRAWLHHELAAID